MEFIVEIIAVIKFGVNDRDSNSTGSWRFEVRPDTAKLTNVIIWSEKVICSSKMKPRFRAEWEVSIEELYIFSASWFLIQMSKN